MREIFSFGAALFQRWASDWQGFTGFSFGNLFQGIYGWLEERFFRSQCRIKPNVILQHFLANIFSESTRRVIVSLSYFRATVFYRAGKPILLLACKIQSEEWIFSTVMLAAENRLGRSLRGRHSSSNGEMRNILYKICFRKLELKKHTFFWIPLISFFWHYFSKSVLKLTSKYFSL